MLIRVVASESWSKRKSEIALKNALKMQAPFSSSRRAWAGSRSRWGHFDGHTSYFSNALALPRNPTDSRPFPFVFPPFVPSHPLPLTTAPTIIYLLPRRISIAAQLHVGPYAKRPDSTNPAVPPLRLWTIAGLTILLHPLSLPLERPQSIEPGGVVLSSSFRTDGWILVGGVSEDTRAAQ